MHLDHGERIALAIDAQSGPQPIDLLREREMAGRQLQERRGCRGAIGNIVKIVVAETGAEGRRDAT